MAKTSGSPALYTIYPLSSLSIYNGATLLHYALGSLGIIIGYAFSGPAILFGLSYLAFALIQMYILMPLLVCPYCVYVRLNGSRCISGLNLVSRRVTRPGPIENFSRRGEGLLCHNNLYLTAKILPIVVILPALFFNFSLTLLLIFAAVIGLLVFRIFIIFPKIACVHCRSKNICPNAQAMGLGKR